MMKTLLEEALEALKPFAAMDREHGDLDELACERGVASDKTILTSRDFRTAAAVLEKAKKRKGDKAQSRKVLRRGWALMSERSMQAVYLDYQDLRNDKRDDENVKRVLIVDAGVKHDG